VFVTQDIAGKVCFFARQAWGDWDFFANQARQKREWDL
jgi:hypothetical protein